MSSLKIGTSFKSQQEVGLIEFQGKLQVDEETHTAQHLGVLTQTSRTQKIWNMQTGNYLVDGREKSVTKARAVLKKKSLRKTSSFSIVGLVKEQISCCERPCPLISYTCKTWI